MIVFINALSINSYYQLTTMKLCNFLFDNSTSSSVEILGS